MTARNNAFDSGDVARAGIADVLDLQLSPLGEAAIAVLAPRPGEAILDVGCGAGQTLVQLAGRVGPTGRVVGVDIAPRVLAVARARTAHLPQVALLQADAATVPLADGSFDGVYSRFGVMGFADPIAACARLARLLQPGGRLAFVCWRSLQENELDRLPIEAAGLAITPDPTPFSFERREEIERVLAGAGYVAVSVQAFDAAVSCGGVEATLAVLTTVGALGKILRERPALAPLTVPKLRARLAVCDGGRGVVELGAATWLVAARKA